MIRDQAAEIDALKARLKVLQDAVMLDYENDKYVELEVLGVPTPAYRALYGEVES